MWWFNSTFVLCSNHRGYISCSLTLYVYLNYVCIYCHKHIDYIWLSLLPCELFRHVPSYYFQITFYLFFIVHFFYMFCHIPFISCFKITMITYKCLYFPCIFQCALSNYSHIHFQNLLYLIEIPLCTSSNAFSYFEHLQITFGICDTLTGTANFPPYNYLKSFKFSLMIKWCFFFMF